MNYKDDHYMKLALLEAKKAYSKNEVPVGAVLVAPNGTIISRGYNRTETEFDSCAHAEMIAIRKASRKLKSWRLSGSTIYVTLEPCLMCMGAIINSRIDRIIYGTRDPNGGSIDLVGLNIFPSKIMIKSIDNELVSVCSDLLTDFFRNLRNGKSI